MKRILIGLVFMILLIGIVSAVDYTFKQNQEAEIIIPIYMNDYSLCTTCTCTLSLSYPNGSSLYNGDDMTFNSGYCNLTIPRGELTPLGTYNGNINAGGGGEYGQTPFTIEVSGTGQGNNTIWVTVVLLILLSAINFLVFRRISVYLFDMVFLVMGVAIMYIHPEQSLIGFIILFGSIVIFIVDLTRIKS